MPDEPRDHAVAHVCQHMNLRVVPRSGIGEFQNSEAVDDIEQRDLPSVTEKGETFSSEIENGSAIQWCWKSYREPTHVGRLQTEQRKLPQ